MPKQRKNKNSWETLESELVYQSPFINVRKNKFRTPDGREGVWSIVEKRPFAIVAVINDKNQIVYRREYDYPVDDVLSRLPGGMLDEGEEPLKAVKREVREEVGLEAKTWVPLGWTYTSSGLTTERCYMFLAKDISEVATEEKGFEDVREVIWKDFDSVCSDAFNNPEEWPAFATVCLIKAREYLNNK